MDRGTQGHGGSAMAPEGNERVGVRCGECAWISCEDWGVPCSLDSVTIVWDIS